MSDYNRMRKKALELGGAAADNAKGSIDEWIAESLKLAGTEVYTPLIREYVKSREQQGSFGKVNLPADYFKASAEVGAKRAVEAGKRLADLLE